MDIDFANHTGESEAVDRVLDVKLLLNLPICLIFFIILFLIINN